MSFIYHIYPLGLCNAPGHNDQFSPVKHRIEYLYEWVEHIKNLGATAVCIGPLFESSSHGYDTIDYYHVDRRLGDRRSLAGVVNTFHQNGIKVIFDAVFNHTGRNFWAFRDVRQKNNFSWYCHWFQDLKFGKISPFGDPFTYKAWKKHYSLVKLNLNNKYVKEHLFKAVEMWIHELGCDGLRLDAADCLKVGFIRDLKKFCKKIKPDFWILGEVVHGDYRKRVNDKMLDSVTNYQVHHEFISSINHKNFHILAGALKRQSGEYGAYKNISLYNFLDNHDVNRVGSTIKNQSLLYILYSILFTVPGIPTVYYGSEAGIKGKRSKHSDKELRPFINLNDLYKKNTSLIQAIQKFSFIRNNSEALKYGSYKELYVLNEQFCFARISKKEYIIVLVNSSAQNVSMEIPVPDIKNANLIDVLNNNEMFHIRNHKLKVSPLWSNWARILKLVF